MLTLTWAEADRAIQGNKSGMRPRLHLKLFSGIAAAIVLAQTCAVMAAGTSQLDGFEYRNGTLVFKGGQSLPKPVMDVMESSAGNTPTALVIMHLPATGGDYEALQEQGNRLMLANPEIKRFIVSPDGDAMQICVEAAHSEGSPNPSLQRVGKDGWQLQFPVAAQSQAAQPNPSRVSSETPEPQASGASAAAPAQTSYTVQERRSSKPSLKNMLFGNRATTSAVEIQTPDEVQSMKLTQELQAVIAERDALEKRLVEMQQVLSSGQGPREQSQSGEYDETLRSLGLDSPNPQLRQEAIIRNLRAALLKVSEKLKATETALNAQRVTTHQLANELAGLKHDPAIASDPTLDVPVLLEDSVNPNETIAKAMQTTTQQIKQQEKQVKKHFVYSPPPKLPDPTEVQTRQDEVDLQVAIRENPKNYGAYLKLADLYAGRNQFTQAESVLMKLIAVNPAYSEAYYYLSLVYLAQKRGLEAQAALETYQRLNPKDLEKIQGTSQAIQSAMQGAGKH